MSNTVDFIGSVYNELSKLLNVTDADPSIAMQMAWPGFSLSPQDFKPADAPNGPYDPQVAKETFSHLANIAPTLTKAYFQNSGLEVDDLYEILVTGAIPVGAGPDDVGANPMFKLFGDSQYEFLQARTGSSSDPNSFYYPCLATPANWYDEAAAQSWPSFDMQSGAVKPAAPDSRFVKFGGPTLVNRGVWKLPPHDTVKADTVKLSVRQMVAKIQQPAQLRPAAPFVVLHKPLNLQAAAALKTMPAAAHLAVPLHVNATLTNTPAFAANLARVKAQTLFDHKIMPQSSYGRYKLADQIQTLDLTRKQLNLGHIDLANRFHLTSLINEELPTKPAGTSDNFSISFRYCRVNIDRGWFKLALLKMKNWYMYGTKAGEYSNGSGLDNPGMFPLLPTSFIVIRDLKITANWSNDDRQNLGQATALGFFDIRDSTLNQNTLEVKGLQVLCWLSTVMPQLPPASSP
ncbi:hypothetical protein RugamoR64_37970 [Duganella rhizosphaerae]|uniref:hypothetical protein n=1 Tax=Duganella rhizosphaerae TaxID=2885763 RepID=UPI0030EA0DE6